MTQGFYKNDNGLLIWSADRVLNENFELWIDNKDDYEYPVQGWIWANSEIEARHNLNCYPLSPAASWVLDMESASWIPPVPFPTDDKKYMWDEENIKWIEIEKEIQE